MEDRRVARHLAVSSLYKEDVLDGGHTAIWGSFYDSKWKTWGFACCQGTDRSEPCPLRKDRDLAQMSAAPQQVEEENEDDDPQEAAARSEWYANKLLLDAASGVAPAEPKPRGESKSDEEYVMSFALFWYHSWTQSSGEHRADAKATKDTREAFVPLLQQLKRNAVPKDLLRQIADFADLSAQREYAKANDVYIAITIGKALWHTHLDLGNQRAHWTGGTDGRTMQRQVVEKDYKNASLFDSDPLVQRYVHALKRLVTYMQSVQPNSDPSKAGHITAPIPDKSTLGMPLLRDIRASDGRQREPEWVEPSDPLYSQCSGSRGLAFGQESGRNHPFHGIGQARGI